MGVRIQMNPKETPTGLAEIDAVRANPGFAVHLTDHFISVRWSNGKWGTPTLRPVADLACDPRMMSLHYGQSAFEGMKAVARAGSEVALFRPDMNAARFARSAKRLAMPPYPEADFLEACETLVRTEQAWVPTDVGTSLYVRPIMFASEPSLSVRPAQEYELLFLSLPTAPYFNASMECISVGVLDEYSRAAKGGTGDIKCAGNYAASYLAKQIAHDELHCDEVLWLDAETHSYVEELSGMNVAFIERRSGYKKPCLVTPRLDGTILPGVTRDSLIQLAPTLGIDVNERDVYLEELEMNVASGEVREAFACGTAAVVAPIHRIVRRDADDITFGDGEPGEVTRLLFDEIVAIQRGESDRFPTWRHVVSGTCGRER